MSVKCWNSLGRNLGTIPFALALAVIVDQLKYPPKWVIFGVVRNALIIVIDAPLVQSTRVAFGQQRAMAWASGSIETVRTDASLHLVSASEISPGFLQARSWMVCRFGRFGRVKASSSIRVGVSEV